MGNIMANIPNQEFQVINGFKNDDMLDITLNTFECDIICIKACVN